MDLGTNLYFKLINTQMELFKWFLNSSILITKGFQQLKSYKNPKYKDYTQDSFQKNGTIDWISNIYTNENGTFNFTIPHFNQEKIRLNIQGIDNLGQLYYQNIIIDVK